MVIILSCIGAAISFLISDSKAFGWLRKLPQRLSYPFDIFFEKLLSCGYCVSNWAAFGLLCLYGEPIINYWYPLDLILTTLLVAWLSTFQYMIMLNLFKRTKL